MAPECYLDPDSLAGSVDKWADGREGREGKKGVIMSHLSFFVISTYTNDKILLKHTR